jgi:hypothetical protein
MRHHRGPGHHVQPHLARGAAQAAVGARVAAQDQRAVGCQRLGTRMHVGLDPAAELDPRVGPLRVHRLHRRVGRKIRRRAGDQREEAEVARAVADVAVVRRDARAQIVAPDVLAQE